MKKKKFWAWLWVALCIVAIFLVVPLARTIQEFVSAHGGRSLFGYAVLMAIAGAFVGVLFVLVFRFRIWSFSRLIWLAAVAGLYVHFTLKLWKNPEEAVHFLEYGLLGFLLFRALSLSVRDKSIYLMAFFIGSLVGMFDEILQWITPGRYWDFRDVGLNALATGLFQVALWRAIQPRLISERITTRSLRRASVLLAANLILLGLCASNTPARVSSYVHRFSFLSFLLKEEPMSEFSQKHADPEIGFFYSRLTLEELKSQDWANAAHSAGILREWKNKDYRLFLSQHSPLLHPFLHEMRVHIFRRDKKEEEACQAENKERAQAALLAAFKENLILEKYFRQTLQKSSYAWDEEKKNQIERKMAKGGTYESPVSRGILYIQERTLWLAVLTTLILVILLNIHAGRKLKLNRPPA